MYMLALKFQKIAFNILKKLLTDQVNEKKIHPSKRAILRSPTKL